MTAIDNRTPEYQLGPDRLDPDNEENLEKINAWIHETHLNEPWTQTYRDWEQGYLRLLELGEAVPEKEAGYSGAGTKFKSSH